MKTATNRPNAITFQSKKHYMFFGVNLENPLTQKMQEYVMMNTLLSSINKPLVSTFCYKMILVLPSSD